MQRRSVIVLMMVWICFAADAQTAQQLITVGEDGFFTQSSPDDAPQPISGLAVDGWTALSPDQRYAAQRIVSPEFLQLPDDEQVNFNTYPENILLIDLETGETLQIAGQPEGEWLYRSPPVWSPDGTQFVFAEFSLEQGVSAHLYDVERQTLTRLGISLPAGYSDAGFFGIPQLTWADFGIYSFVSHIAEDEIGFAQTLTVIDPVEQQLVLNKVIGRTLSGGEPSRDTLFDLLPGLNEEGEPTILMVDSLGEWYALNRQNFNRARVGTPVFRPAGGGDLELRFVRASALLPEDRLMYPHYRLLVRRGDAPFETLDIRTSRIYPPFVAPDGSSVIYWDGEQYVQWSGQGEQRALDFDGRTILDWGDWLVEAQPDCYYEPIVGVLERSMQTARVISPEPLEMRDTPGDAGDMIGEVQPGELVRVVTGPLCLNRVNWFEVVVGEDDQHGWIPANFGGRALIEDFH